MQEVFCIPENSTGRGCRVHAPICALLAADVQPPEELMFSDGVQGFSLAGWDQPGQSDSQQNAPLYFLATGILIDNYIRTDAGAEPVEKIIQRLESIFPREQFSDIYAFFDATLKQENGEDIGAEESFRPDTTAGAMVRRESWLLSFSEARIITVETVPHNSPLGVRDTPHDPHR